MIITACVAAILYVLFGAITADAAADEAKALGSPAPSVSLLIIAAAWPAMLGARFIYRFVRKY